MTRLARNAYISTMDMDGIPKYTSRFIQLDDRPPTAEKLLDKIPIIAKIVYDFADAVYSRGDVVTILSVNNFKLPPEDNLFYVERALKVGPISGRGAATEISLLGGRITNATISGVLRPVRTPSGRGARANEEDQPVIRAPIRVTYVPPDQEKIFSYGDSVTSILIGDPDQDWAVGDSFTVSKINGNPRVDTIYKYKVKFVARHPTPVPHIHIEFTGALQ